MRRIYQRAIYYNVGIIILTFGIALTIQSKLGTSPFDALLVGLFRTFGLTIGSWEIVVGLVMILFNALAERRRPELLALATSLFTGVCIDFWVFTLEGSVEPQALVSQSICSALGILFSGLGIAINLQANFAPNPFDRTMLVVRKLTGWNISFSRGFISVILVVLAAIFSGPIGIGTLLSTFLSGIVIHFFIIYVTRFDYRLSKEVTYAKNA